MTHPVYIGQSLPKSLDKPLRVLCLVPSITETLCELGLEPYLVGITSFCLMPEGIQNRISRVGGTKKINLKKAEALKPDFVIANKEENTLEMVEALRALAPVWVTKITSLTDAWAMWQQLEQLFRLAPTARLEAQATAQAQLLQLQALDDPPKVLYLIWANPYMAAASATFIHSMIEAARMDNVMAQYQRYPVLKPDMGNPEPDWVLCASEPYTFTPVCLQQVQQQWPNAKVIEVDGTYFSWYGSRMRHAFAYLVQLRQQLHDLRFGTTIAALLYSCGYGCLY